MYFQHLTAFVSHVFGFVSVEDCFVALLGFIISPVLDLTTNALKHLKRGVAQTAGRLDYRDPFNSRACCHFLKYSRWTICFVSNERNTLGEVILCTIETDDLFEISPPLTKDNCRAHCLFLKRGGTFEVSKCKRSCSAQVSSSMSCAFEYRMIWIPVEVFLERLVECVDSVSRLISTASGVGD